MKRLFWLCLLTLALGLGGWAVWRALIPTSAWTRVEHGNVIRAVPGSVTVSALMESQVASPEAGLVLPDGFTLKVGDAVKAHQLLAQLAPGQLTFLRNDADIKLLHLRGLLDKNNPSGGRLESEITLELMQQQLKFKADQQAHDFIGKAEYDEYAQQVAAQQAKAARDRSDLESEINVQQNLRDNYQDQLERLEIRAPYDGFITAVSAHPGDLLAKGDVVASMISKEVKIQAEVNQDDIAAVFPGERAEIHFPAYADKFLATVKLVLPNSDKATQRFTVLLEVANLSTQVVAARPENDSPAVPPPGNPGVQLFAGLKGEVSFIAGEHDRVLIIPRRAMLGNGDSGSSVFVVNHGVVEVRQVKPVAGFVTLTKAEIGENSDAVLTVHDGEIVLTENLDTFRNGDRVRLVPDPKDAAARKP